MMGMEANGEGRGDEVCCERCGVAMSERERANGWTVCDSCYAIRGSCCPEFGPDDLTGCEGNEGADRP